ncbi:MAG: NF038143 family protein [Thermodesulfobacteriota bacterium]
MLIETVMNGFDRKKTLILERELDFSNAIGAAVVEKPRISFWMILIPILFLYFLYRMQTYKEGRLKFDQEFMAARRRAMEVAVEAVKTGGGPDIDRAVRQSEVAVSIEKPYACWVRVLTEHYMDLLSATGDSFESLVRSAYCSRTNYLLALNRLSTVEKEFYDAMKPQLSSTEGAAEIITTIETKSQHLRRKFAEQIFV